MITLKMSINASLSQTSYEEAQRLINARGDKARDLYVSDLEMTYDMRVWFLPFRIRIHELPNALLFARHAWALAGDEYIVIVEGV